MIHIFMALYAEARPMIERLELKKINSGFKFTQYASDELCLTITGAGGIAASTAVGAVCASRELCETDFVVNIGTCAGSRERIGSLYMIHKLTDAVTGRTFYPDILYRHGMAEAELVTVPLAKSDQTQSEDLFDMEGAAVYQAASYFVGPHQLQFLKVVSDEGDGKWITPAYLTDCVEKHMDEITELLNCLKEISNDRRAHSQVFSGEEKLWLQKLYDDLHCSTVMQASLEQLCRYWKLSGTDYKAHISRRYEQGVIPCKDKRKGKRLIDEFRKELL